MMPGGDKEAYKALEPIVSKVAAQVTHYSMASLALLHPDCYLTRRVLIPSLRHT
jgi:6-phosphogluconate dehydrogenase (decarboxylating)